MNIKNKKKMEFSVCGGKKKKDESMSTVKSSTFQHATVIDIKSIPWSYS